MIDRKWFEISMRFREKTALAMEQYTKVAGIDLEKIAHMSDVDIACDFHAGVHRKLFSARDVRKLVERLDSHCKYRPQTRLFLNLFDFLTEELELSDDLAQCMAFGFNMTPTQFLSCSNDDISERLYPAFLEGWLGLGALKSILTSLDQHYPNRLQRSQSSTASTAASRANPYVV